MQLKNRGTELSSHSAGTRRMLSVRTDVCGFTEFSGFVVGPGFLRCNAFIIRK